MLKKYKKTSGGRKASEARKYLNEKDLVTKNWSGCPKLINNENKKHWKKIVKRNNHKSAEQIKNKFNEAVIENDGWPTKYWVHTWIY